MPRKDPKNRTYKPRFRCNICHKVMSNAEGTIRWHMILPDGSDSYSHDECGKAQRK